MFTYKYTSYLFDSVSESFNELSYNYHKSFQYLRAKKDGISMDDQKSLVSQDPKIFYF